MSDSTSPATSEHAEGNTGAEAHGEPRLYIAIGASAGGLQPIKTFFAHIPPDTGMAFVVVQHLSPDFKSLMDELLARDTIMPIHKVEDGMPVLANNIYLIPPRMNMRISAGRLCLEEQDVAHAMRFPIDIFMQSLAAEVGGRAVGVILSGTGSDGTRGIQAIKEAGGLVLVQESSSAAFDGMPRSAQNTGVVDFVLTPEAIAERLVSLSDRNARIDDGTADQLELEGRQSAELFGLLRAECGVDFSHYKQSTMRRRIQNRIALAQVDTFDRYMQIVRNDPAEVALLARDLLISVTRFFRDPEVYATLRTVVLPELCKRIGRDLPLRVWVTACATGEEAYSLGILLQEHFDAIGRSFHVKILATDVDRDAIRRAAQGIYPENIEADLTPEQLQRFFVRRGAHYQVAPVLREMVIFAQQNLLCDPPFTKIDLISCRNMLIYLKPPLQSKVLATLNFALRPDGFLLLGKSETIGRLSREFAPVEPSHRIYRSLGLRTLPPVDLLRTVGTDRSSAPQRKRFTMEEQGLSVQSIELIYQALVEHLVTCCVIVDERGQLLHVFGDVGRFVKVRPGRATLNIFEMADRGLALPLLTAVRMAGEQQRDVTYKDVGGAEPDNGFSFRVKPMRLAREERTLFFVIFEDIDSRASVNLAPSSLALDEASRQRIDVLESDLRITRENLQATIEEMETTNEELQATNEELMASNEELQSTNEELQSVNEELYTVNAEYQNKIRELIDLNADINNLYRTVDVGVIFLDDNLNVRKFNPAAAKQVFLLDKDIDRPLAHISHSFQDGQPLELADQAHRQHKRVERTLLGRDGQQYLVRATPYLLSDNREAGVVLTLVDTTELARTRDQLQQILDSLPEHIAVIDRDGTIVSVNRTWREFAEANGAGLDKKCGLGANYLEACFGPNGDDGIGRLAHEGLTAVLEGRSHAFSLEYPCHSPTEKRWFLMHARPLNGSMLGAVISHVNITNEKYAEAERVQLEAQVQHAQKLESLGLLAGGIAHDFNNLLGGVLNNAELALMDATAGTPMYEAIENVRTAGMRCSELANQMLAYSGKGRFVIRLTNLNAVIEEMLHLLHSSISKKVRLSFDFDRGIPDVMVDAAQVRQVILNLITNATDAIGERAGEIIVRTGRTSVPQHELEIDAFDRSAPGAGVAYVEVEDTGGGIAPDVKGRIFDPFFTTKFTGRGLGLAAVSGIVRSHRGGLMVDSKPGLGTRFRVLLPLPTAPTSAPAAEPHASEDLPWRGEGTVLVVDDEDSILLSTKRLLERIGFTVLTARDGLEAMDVFQEHRAKIRLVLLDITMPRMNGHEVLKAMTHIDPEARVVLTSGYSEVDACTDSDNAATAFIQKPYRFHELKEKLRMILDPEAS